MSDTWGPGQRLGDASGDNSSDEELVPPVPESWVPYNELAATFGSEVESRADEVVGSQVAAVESSEQLVPPEAADINGLGPGFHREIEVEVALADAEVHDVDSDDDGSEASTHAPIMRPSPEQEARLGELMELNDILSDIGLVATACIQRMTHRYQEEAREIVEMFTTELAIINSDIEAAVQEPSIPAERFKDLDKRAEEVGKRWIQLKQRLKHFIDDKPDDPEKPDDDDVEMAVASSTPAQNDAPPSLAKRLKKI